MPFTSPSDRLDTIAELYGCRKRYFLESDAQFRKCVIESIEKDKKMSYNPHNVKVTVGGVELNGCSDAEFKQEHKKDYSLLRPFDLEAAKAGELLIDSDYDAVRFVGSATKSDEVCVEINSISLLVCRPEDLFMAPLAWVEGRPVYKDSVLYGIEECYRYRYDVDRVDGEFVFSKKNNTSSNFEHVSNLTWTKPKQKREGWVNIYKDRSACMYRYDTKEQAELAAPSGICIDTVRIEWEE